MGIHQPEEEFIKHILNVDVDAGRRINVYTVIAMYDVMDEEGYAELEQRTVEEVTLSWDEIKKRGGVHVVNEEFNSRYNFE